jgi:hypothetical protein
VINKASDFAANCLSQMQEQLIALREDTNSQLPCQAIQLAKQQDEEFVNDPKLWVMFLRAEHFHAKRAAARMIRFFDLKLLLFGESKLCKVITLEDLDPDEIATIKKGIFQTLPQRDQVGRRVDVLFEVNHKWKSPESLVRISVQVRGVKRSIV